MEIPAVDALFFPTLSLPSATWTNPNLLFFDQIGVIAPDGDRRNLFDGPTRTLMEYDLVRPVAPERFARADDEDDGRVVSHCLGMMHAHRSQREIAHIHLGKIAHTHLPSELRALQLLWATHHPDWLEGPAWVVGYLMSVLAVRISLHPDINASLVTNEQSAERLVVGLKRVAQDRSVRRLRAVSRLLPVGPDADIAEIVSFRQNHRRELQSFRQFVEALALRHPTGEEGEQNFEARLRGAEELRRHLVGELEAVRESFAPMPLALSVAAIAAPMAEHSPFSTTVGVGGLGYLLYTAARAHQRYRAARKDKLVYAAYAAGRFAARRADDLLR